ncbi:MBL fold metallo-hydrolase [Lentihominibacter sp.]|uniref:MBL fold metallo-hydrolase n=1 Tax=Lentihominibacter sp. TaxID=2944216 RepID=UPI0015A70693
MKIKRFICGMLESNGYVIYQQDGADCYVIDPGYGPNVFKDFIKEHSLYLKGILLTHYHYDHVGAVQKLKDFFDCPVYMHRYDCDLYKKDVDVYLEDGDIIYLDGEAIRVINTPGHTKGSVCFFSERSKLAFTGDTVFNVDLGRTDLESGSESDMRKSIHDIVDTWGNDIMIYPGHGDGCTMKTVRKINREFIDIVNER